MTTSVVMCTYNGEKYIEEQLITIFRQSRQPDEVLITDDGSADRTVSIIKTFIQKHALEAKWHLFENSVNLGWKKNFMETIRRASGDLIFLADQDDIWHKSKMEIMTDVCEQHPKIHILVCDCFPFDDETGKRKKWFLPDLGEEFLNQVSIERSFAESLRPGCTYALRGDWKETVVDLWEEQWPHDLFFWCMALAQDGLYHCRKVLVKWRRAEENNTPKNEKNRDCRLEVLDRQYRITKCIVEHSDKLQIGEAQLTQMETAMRIYRQRADAIENKDYRKLMRLLGDIRYYPKNSSWLADILAALR